MHTCFWCQGSRHTACPAAVMCNGARIADKGATITNDAAQPSIAPIPSVMRCGVGGCLECFLALPNQSQQVFVGSRRQQFGSSFCRIINQDRECLNSYAANCCSKNFSFLSIWQKVLQEDMVALDDSGHASKCSRRCRLLQGFTAWGSRCWQSCGRQLRHGASG